jgi:hypothetical protein
MIELDMTADDPAERLVRLRRFEAAVEINRGLDIGGQEGAARSRIRRDGA